MKKTQKGQTKTQNINNQNIKKDKRSKERKEGRISPSKPFGIFLGAFQA